MALTLCAVSLDDRPLTSPIRAQFDARGGTIGRAGHNTLALPDPDRYISREQASIIADGDSFLILNTGGSNPIHVRCRALGQGESAPLMAGDKVRIGGYLVEVIDDLLPPRELPDGALPSGRARLNAAPATPTATAAPRRPLATSGSTRAVAFTIPAVPTATGAGTPCLTSDFDPFDPCDLPMPSLPSTTITSALDTRRRQPDRPGPGRAETSIDDLIAEAAADVDGPLATFMKQTRLSTARRGAGTNGPVGSERAEPLAMVGSGMPRSPATAPPVRPDLVTSLRAAAPLWQCNPSDATTASSRLTATKPPSAVGAPISADAAAMWSAFCEGAGVDLDADGLVPDESMRQVGAMLRVALDGMQQLSTLRAALRQELRAPVTPARAAAADNPLTAALDARSSLEQLLRPPSGRCLQAPALVAETMNDLIAHAIATMAGSRAAFEGALGRFAPDELEAKLVGRSLLETVLPQQRKARLWDLFREHHGSIVNEAQLDFHKLFDRAFLSACEQPVDRPPRGQALQQG